VAGRARTGRTSPMPAAIQFQAEQARQRVKAECHELLCEAIELPSLIVVSADAQQQQTAAVEGFSVEDPNEHC